jgi:hypothetical protein
MVNGQAVLIVSTTLIFVRILTKPLRVAASVTGKEVADIGTPVKATGDIWWTRLSRLRNVSGAAGASGIDAGRVFKARKARQTPRRLSGLRTVPLGIRESSVGTEMGQYRWTQRTVCKISHFSFMAQNDSGQDHIRDAYLPGIYCSHITSLKERK